MLKSNYHKTLLALTLVLSSLSVLFGQMPARAATPQLPNLNWQKRSDWVNVKTDVTPAAVGDGVHDDTAALQAALSRIKNASGAPLVVYLPAGTYRITKTLFLATVIGAAMIGNGQATRIVWDGPAYGNMFMSSGATRSRYIGIVWDGAGKAAVGINHCSKTYYETRIRHQDEAFVNFQEAGIQVGYAQVLPTAEMMFRNCLFQGCKRGVSFLSWNDYDNDFDGCEFQSCGTGINCLKGNVYVRDCHFQNSALTDLRLCSQSHSIRRCTSIGSKQFIATGLAGSGCEVTVQDCRVDSWTGSQGAMAFGMRGPTTVFDCVFTHAPDTAPPIRLVNYKTVQQLATLSNNVTSGASSIIDQGPNAAVITLPAGARGPSLTDPTQSFFKSSETVPGTTVIDVKANYGAKGDGHTDDTLPITRALVAAAKLGGNALVYLPVGTYNVSASLPITGGNYTVGGSGYGTIVQWVSSKNSPVFAVKDPQSVTMEQMQIKAPDDVPCIQQRSAGGASAMTYDGVYVGGSWLGPGDSGGSNGNIGSHRANRGLECIGLPAGALVQMPHFDGSIHFTDCSQATILVGFSVDGVLQVDGSDYAKSGFLGLLGHFTSGNPCDVIVRDNQDLIGTDFYAEQTQSHLAVSGDGAYPGQPGHVTIQGVKSQTYASPITINDYEGRVTYTGALCYGQTSHPLTHSGTRPVDIVLMDNAFAADDPTFQLGFGAQMTLLQNVVVNDESNSAVHTVVNQLPGLSTSAVSTLLGSLTDSANAAPAASALADAVAALDDFRLLGAADLVLNHP